MKEFLESLEIGDGKIKLSKDEITSILTENGKIVKKETDKVRTDLTNEINNYKTTITNLETKINDAGLTYLKLLNERLATTQCSLDFLSILKYYEGERNGDDYKYQQPIYL